MSKINIYETGWLNMVFEGRNKAYGAYQLRSENPKTTIKAFFSAIILLGSAAAIPAVVDFFQPEPVAEVIPKNPDEVILVTEFIAPPEKIEPEVPETPALPVNQNTTKFINMVVKEKEKATEEVATNNQLETSQVAQTTSEGPATIVAPVIPTPNTGGEGGNSNAIETTTGLEVQPEYPGGIGAFLSKVGKSFRAPEVEEEIKSLRVLVYFVIEKDGTLSNIRVTKDPGYSVGKEAIRVLNNMKTKWSPGYKNGQPVRTAFNLPITINVN